jgi:uncharacterized protein (DUF427 family)
MKAIWNGKIIAESEKTIRVEGNYYFPPETVNREYLSESSTHTVCGWKGVASYYDIRVNGKVNRDGAWYYPQPKAAARNIQNYVAFWHGVEITEG